VGIGRRGKKKKCRFTLKGVNPWSTDSEERVEVLNEEVSVIGEIKKPSFP